MDWLLLVLACAALLFVWYLLVNYVPFVSRLINKYQKWSYDTKLYELSKSRPLEYGDAYKASQRSSLEKKKAKVQKQIDRL